MVFQTAYMDMLKGAHQPWGAFDVVRVDFEFISVPSDECLGELCDMETIPFTQNE